MLVRLADWCYRRRRAVIALWIAALVGSFALSSAFGGEFRQDYLQPGSESQAASKTLEERFPQQSGDTVQIVLHADDGVGSPGVGDRQGAVQHPFPAELHPFLGAAADSRHDSLLRPLALSYLVLYSPRTKYEGDRHSDPPP